MTRRDRLELLLIAGVLTGVMILVYWLAPQRCAGTFPERGQASVETARGK